MKDEETRAKHTLVGVDLGQARDWTAISVVKQLQDYKKDAFDGWGAVSQRYYHVLHLERPPLETSYEDVVNRVKSILKQLKGGKLIIDYTGCGRPVFDMFKRKGLRPYGISITGGNTVTEEGNIYNVPKRDLAATLQVLYQQQRIKVSGKLDHAKTLNNELMDFKVKIDPETGHDSYEHRTGAHDDLVLSVAIATWYGENGIREFTVTKAAKAIRDLF